MNKKSISTAVTIIAFLIGSFLPLLLSSCGSDDNADFNVYFVGVGNNTNQNFYDNPTLQKFVSSQLSTLNQHWQTKIMNEKEAKQEFEEFSLKLENNLKSQVTESKLTIVGETYFTLVLSHSVKHGQEYPVISTYKIVLAEADNCKKLE